MLDFGFDLKRLQAEFSRGLATGSPYVNPYRVTKRPRRISRTEEDRRARRAIKKARKVADREALWEKHQQVLIDRAQESRLPPAALAVKKPAKALSYKNWYRKVYLLSDHWKFFRLQYIESHGSLCELCKASEGSELHHMSYERLFAEKDCDVRFLCVGCHDGIHGHRSSVSS